MSGRVRTALFGVGALVLAALFVLAYRGLPGFGSQEHPYGDRAVATALARQTSNAVSSVNFDQRAVDTLGEEYILFGAVTGTLVILRPLLREREDAGPAASTGRVLSSTRLAGHVLLPVTLLVGAYLVDHGQVSPGGGFQGGVVLATAWHLLYVADRYRTLDRLRPSTVFEFGEAVGAGAFAALGVATLAVTGSFLANSIARGSLTDLASGGTVPVLNIAVGVEVASGVIVLLSAFLRQDVLLRGSRNGESGKASGSGGGGNGGGGNGGEARGSPG